MGTSRNPIDFQLIQLLAFPILNVMAAKSIESMHVVAMMAVNNGDEVGRQ